MISSRVTGGTTLFCVYKRNNVFTHRSRLLSLVSGPLPDAGHTSQCPTG
jgi:hypothetical protein